jgi:hypothetical protein
MHGQIQAIVSIKEPDPYQMHGQVFGGLSAGPSIFSSIVALAGGERRHLLCGQAAFLGG